MTSKQSSEAADSPLPAGADDLKQVKGIGAGIEKRLHGAGILTFAQLAAKEPAEVVTLIADVPGMSVGRVTKQNWIGQASQLASTHEQGSIEPVGDTADHENRQHYAIFKVELLLDEDNNVRRTRVWHIQKDGQEDAWAGWEGERLVSFVAQCAGMRQPQPTSPAPDTDSNTAPSETSAVSALQHVEAEIQAPRPDVQLEIGDIALEEVPFAEQDETQRPKKRVHTELHFSLSGADAISLAAQELPYSVQILACKPEIGQTIVLGTKQDVLCPEQTDYIVALEHELPEIGEYLVLGGVTLPAANCSGFALGPALTVVP